VDNFFLHKPDQLNYDCVHIIHYKLLEMMKLTIALKLFTYERNSGFRPGLRHNIFTPSKQLNGLEILNSDFHYIEHLMLKHAP